MSDRNQLDEFDHQILRHLQRDALATGEEIGAEVCLSAAAVQRRIKRLRQIGAIRATVAVLDPAMIGQTMSFVISVELERERADMLDAFRRAAREDPNVQQCYYVTGSTDFVLMVTARDMADFELFTRRLLFDNANVRRFTTNVVLSRDKVGVSLPL